MRFLTQSGLFAIVALTLGSPVQGSWPFVTGDWVLTSPSIADINGDGALEIVFGSADGNLYCLDIAGNLMWSTPLYDGIGYAPQLQSSPTLVNLDNDPTTLEVLMGSWDDQGGLLYCLAANGAVRATFTTETAVFSPPLVCDLENDGQLEILFGDVRLQNGPPVSMYCVSVVSAGAEIKLAERWHVSYLDGSLFAAPAIADFDGDGVQEIVVSIGGTINSSSDNAALFCLNSDGGVIWSFHLAGSIIYNTPAISDVDGDGQLDVIVAPFNDDLYCLNGLTGAVKWHFDHAGASILNSPAVANIRSSPGLADVVFGSYSADWLYCVNSSGGQWWKYKFAPEWTGFSSPGVADVDGDGNMEIAVATATPAQNGPSRMYLFNHNGGVVWSKIMPSAVNSSPALADLDGDGSMEIAFGCLDHKFYVLDANGNTFVPNPNTKPTELAPWPTYRQNNQRTGFHPRKPVLIPGDINVDGHVNVADLLIVINSWGPCPLPPKPGSCPADIAPAPKGDATVNVSDLLKVINNWQ